MSIEITNTLDVTLDGTEVTKTSSTDIVSTNTHCITPEEQTSIVEGYKKEYSIVGDGLYASVNVEDTPQWLATLIDNVVANSIANGMTDYELLVQDVRNAIDALDVAANTYVEQINIDAIVNGIITTRLTTLNATYENTYATKVELTTAVATSEFALLQDISDLSVSFNDEIDSRITEVQTAFAAADEALASDVTALESAFISQEGELSATATAVSGLQTYVGLDEDSVPDGTGMLSAITILQKQNDGIIEYTIDTYDVMIGVEDPNNDTSNDQLDVTQEPYASWIAADVISGTEETRASHIGDVYIQYEDDSNGTRTYIRSYKFIKTAVDGSEPYSTDTEGYTWALITDTDAQSAYVIALNAQDLADKKRRVFVDTPYPPYDIGDLWVTDNGDNGSIIKRCTTAKLITGAYDVNDWTIVATDDYTVNVLNTGLEDGTVAINLSSATIDGTTNLATYVAEEIDKEVVVYSGTDHTEHDTAGIIKVNDIYIESTTSSDGAVDLDVVNTWKCTAADWGTDAITWEQINSNDNLTALADLADGKRTVFGGSTVPTGAVERDLWIPETNVDTGLTGTYKFTNDVSEEVSHIAGRAGSGTIFEDIVESRILADFNNTGTVTSADALIALKNANGIDEGDPTYTAYIYDVVIPYIVTAGETSSWLVTTFFTKGEIYQYNGANWIATTRYTEDLNDFIDAATDIYTTLQNQVDGKIEYYFYDSYTDISTATDESDALGIIKSAWSTQELQEANNGNIIYFKDTRNAYWYQSSTNAWITITDTSIYEALQDAAAAQGAADGKVSQFYAWGGTAAPADYIVSIDDEDVTISGDNFKYWFKTDNILYYKPNTTWIAVPTSSSIAGSTYIASGDLLTVFDPEDRDTTNYSYNGASWQTNGPEGIIAKSKFFVDLDADVNGPDGIAAAQSSFENTVEAYARNSSGEILSGLSAVQVGWTTDTTATVGESDADPISTCQSALTYAEAVAFALARGLRLPTAEEVQAGVGQGTGCSFDSAFIWTSTPGVTPGTHYVVLGNCSDPTTDIEERDDTLDAACRFVADSQDRLDSANLYAQAKFEYNSTVTVNGISQTAGFGLVNELSDVTGAPTAGNSEFWINAEKFKFTNTAQSGTAAPFTIDASGATPQITFNGAVSFNSVNDVPDYSLNSSIGGSLAPPFTSWLNIANFETAADTIQLDKDSGYPETAQYYPIDATKSYKVRFKARPVGADGRLYFCLRQYTDKDAVGPSNSGRSPYYPSGVTAAEHGTDWVTYEYLWHPSVWQTGCKYVRPNFLNNYQGTNGYWEITDFYMFEAADVTDYAAINDDIQNVSDQLPQVVNSTSIPTSSNVYPEGTIWRQSVSVSVSGTISTEYVHWLSEGAGTWRYIGGTYIDGSKIVTGSIETSTLAADYIVVGGAAGDINSGTTTINGSNITAGSIEASALAADYIVVGEAAGDINSGSTIIEGTKIKTSNLYVDYGNITNVDIQTADIGAAQVDTLQLAGECLFIPRAYSNTATVNVTTYSEVIVAETPTFTIDNAGQTIVVQFTGLAYMKNTYADNGSGGTCNQVIKVYAGATGSTLQFSYTIASLFVNSGSSGSFSGYGHVMAQVPSVAGNNKIVIKVVNTGVAPNTNSISNRQLLVQGVQK